MNLAVEIIFLDKILRLYVRSDLLCVNFGVCRPYVTV
jgi:hypothetical protein